MIALYRIDDRLVHGQVVLGWGQSLNAAFIVLVDDDVAASGWEQELYRLGVPPDIELLFCTVEQAVSRHQHWVDDKRIGILLTPDLGTMNRLLSGVSNVRRVNIGGIHHKSGREQKLRYVYLTEAEEEVLRSMAERGVEITAQDVPVAQPVPLKEVLAGSGTG